MKIKRFLKRHAGKIVLGAGGVAAGLATGGIGIVMLGTGFGIPATVTPLIGGGVGAAVGRKVDKMRSS